MEYHKRSGEGVGSGPRLQHMTCDGSRNGHATLLPYHGTQQADDDRAALAWIHVLRVRAGIAHRLASEEQP